MFFDLLPVSWFPTVSVLLLSLQFHLDDNIQSGVELKGVFFGDV